MLEDYFENIDTKDKAYWLGFIMADGHNNTKRHTIRLCISEKDESLIDKFIKAIDGDPSDKRYYENKFGSSDAYGTKKHKRVYYTIHNKKMSEDLKKWGCKSPKIENITLFECGDEELELCWLMGYYDGDGSATNCDLYSKDKNFLVILKEKYDLKSEVKLRTNPYGSCYSLNLRADMKRRILKAYPHGLERKRKTYYNDKLIKFHNPKYKELDRPERRRFNIEKEELDKLINSDKISLEEIGRRYGVTGQAVKKRAKRLGIYHGRQKNYKG